MGTSQLQGRGFKTHSHNDVKSMKQNILWPISKQNSCYLKQLKLPCVFLLRYLKHLH